MKLILVQLVFSLVALVLAVGKVAGAGWVAVSWLTIILIFCGPAVVLAAVTLVVLLILELNYRERKKRWYDGRR